MTPRKLRVMPGWAHVAFWLGGKALGVGAVGHAIIGLLAAARNEPPRILNNSLYLFAYAIGVVLVWGVWRRFWFLPSDLAALLKAQGGRVERSRRNRRTQRARIGDVWLLASLDRPIRDYWPAPLFRTTRLGLHRIRSGLQPDYMMRGARVEVVRPGDFSRLPRTTVKTTPRLLAADDARTGDASLDRALRDGTAGVGDPDMPIVVEIDKDWLRVETDGGSWLGVRFTRRLEDLLTVMQRVLRSLDGRFTPRDADAWSAEREGDALRVGINDDSRRRSVDWKAIVLSLFLLLPRAADASQETAAAFLLAAQEADGEWSSKFARRTHTTREVLRALQELGSNPSARGAAADLLEALSVEDVDNRARRIDTLYGKGAMSRRCAPPSSARPIRWVAGLPPRTSHPLRSTQVWRLPRSPPPTR